MTDDGSGFEADDLRVAGQRYYTSKLHDGDLSTLQYVGLLRYTSAFSGRDSGNTPFLFPHGTAPRDHRHYGYRGEALASLQCIGVLDIVSRHRISSLT